MAAEGFLRAKENELLIVDVTDKLLYVHEIL